MKLLLLIAFLAVGSVGLSQQFGTLIVSDYDDPTIPVEGAGIYFDGQLLGTTDHVGSFRFPAAIKGTITLSHPSYVTRELKVKTKKGLVIDTNLLVTPAVYDSLKAIDSAVIYRKCVVEDLPVTVIDLFNPVNASERAFSNYISAVQRYPKRARDNGQPVGSVFMRFRIEADGTVSCVEIGQSGGFEVDKEAFRILSNMPKWEPAMKNGQPVPAIYSVNILLGVR